MKEVHTPATWNERLYRGRWGCAVVLKCQWSSQAEVWFSQSHPKSMGGREADNNRGQQRHALHISHRIGHSRDVGHAGCLDRVSKKPCDSANSCRFVDEGYRLNKECYSRRRLELSQYLMIVRICNEHCIEDVADGALATHQHRSCV
nr:hypothetical protein CFP56_13193 [Quercus suber]